MSGDTTMYAAGLGLLIPLVGVSVCRKLWTHGIRFARGRRPSDGKGLFNLTFVVQVLVLSSSIYAFNHLASSMQTETEHFDPYHILDLPSRANSTMIKSQYRRLSLMYHPDKNPGKRSEANKKFNRVAKAYKALSDPEARRNWEKYGHPDGYQPWTFDLAVPGWLRPGKDTGNGTLALYGLGYMAVLIGFVVSVKVMLDVMDPAGGQKKTDFEVTEEDVEALLKNLDDTSSTADVLECLAACPQLCSEERRTLAQEMEPITTPLRRWLLALDGGAPPLRVPHSSSSSSPHTAGPSKNTTRKGKGKGFKSKGGGGGGAGAASAGVPATSGGQKEPEVEGEFFSQGRKGEGNRRSTRESPELSKVVTHNLVVLLSALHRAPPEVVAGAGDAAEPGVSPTPVATAAEKDGEASSAGAGGEGKAAEEGGDSLSGVAAAAVAAGEQLADDHPGALGAFGGAGKAAGGAGGDGGDDAVSRLLMAVAAGGQLSREQDLVLGLAEPLLDACLQVAAKRASPQLFGTVVETKAMLRRRLWLSSKEGVEMATTLERQEREVDADYDAAVPRIKVKSVVVETWGEKQVALGDTVTATVTIVREHAAEYQGLRCRRPEAGSFIAKGEPWWVILAGGRGGNSLIRVTPLLVENLGNGIAECKMKFQAPTRPGFVNLVVSVKSPVFVGVDCESTASFRVWRHDELKEDDDAGDW